MRILQICSERKLGGGERHFADLTNNLAGRGHDVYVAVSHETPLLAGLNSVPKENLFELRMRNSLDLRSANRLSKIIKQFEIEIIHAHVGRDYSLAAVASLRSGNVPFVLTRHVLFPINRINRKVLSRATRFIAVSHAVALSLKDQKIVDQEKIVTIHNGIDIDRFQMNYQARSNITVDKGSRSRLLVGMIGHIAAIKGQDVFVRGGAEIVRQRDDVDLVILGDDKSNDGKARAEVETLIKDLGVEDRCRLVGWQDDVGKFLAGLDVFVSPSRSEPFGLVIIEAMASGIPVVATASEGAMEIIEENHTGRLVPIGDHTALAAATLELLNDDEARDRLSRNAFEAVKDRFSLGRMVDRTEALYREVLLERTANR